MANGQPTPGYTPTWAGAMTNNQPLQTQVQPNPAPIPQPQPQPQNWVGMNQWAMPVPTSSVIMALVQSDAAVDNYPVPPNTTAFLMNYGNGVFWTKRQTPDGLGFTTVKHRFSVMNDENAEPAASNASAPQNQNGDLQALSSELVLLREEVLKLRHEFDDFMK